MGLRKVWLVGHDPDILNSSRSSVQNKHQGPAAITGPCLIMQEEDLRVQLVPITLSGENERQNLYLLLANSIEIIGVQIQGLQDRGRHLLV